MHGALASAKFSGQLLGDLLQSGFPGLEAGGPSADACTWPPAERTPVREEKNDAGEVVAKHYEDGSVDRKVDDEWHHFDETGEPTEVRKPNGAGSRKEGNDWVHYDAQGVKRKVEHADGSVDELKYNSDLGKDVWVSYNDRGQLIIDEYGSRITYDEKGQRASVYHKDGSHEERVGEDWVYYDKSGEKVAISFADGSWASKEDGAWVTYNQEGDKVKVQHPDGTLEVKTWPNGDWHTMDKDNRVTRVRREDGSESHLGYDGDGMVSEVRHSDGSKDVKGPDGWTHFDKDGNAKPYPKGQVPQVLHEVFPL
jgi:YD repeat-containing protein